MNRQGICNAPLPFVRRARRPTIDLSNTRTAAPTLSAQEISMPRRCLAALTILLLFGTAAPLRAGDAKDPGRLTIDRIFQSGEFRGEPHGPVRWLSKQPGYTITEPSARVK